MEIRAKVSKVVDAVVGLKCDACGIETNDISGSEWYGFSHSHQGWGNDSDDSFEYFNVCSAKCYFEQIKKSLIELKEFEDQEAEIDEKPIKFIEDILKQKGVI